MNGSSRFFNVKENPQMTKNERLCRSPSITCLQVSVSCVATVQFVDILFVLFFLALWPSEHRALDFFFFFFSRQAQNCHILDPPLMMEGFLCCCCSSACHCEEKKNPPSSLFFPPVLLFLMSRIPFPVFGRTMECSHGP